MGRFSIDDADKYGGQGGGGYFSLKNDKETARVRFMYNGIDDVEGYAVHEVEIDGRKRYVNCLRKYNESIENCPFCKARKPQYAKLFIPLYNIEEDKVQVWERGKKFFQKLSSMCARYPNLVSHMFEIERNGKPGEQTTTYEIYEVGQDDTTLEDLPEFEGTSGIVLEKTAEELERYLETGKFDSDSSDSSSNVVRRGSSDVMPRRTPASRRSGDRF